VAQISSRQTAWQALSSTTTTNNNPGSQEKKILTWEILIGNMKPQMLNHWE
jgi:hypothetical protein